MSRLSKNKSVTWIAGTEAVALAAKAYRILGFTDDSPITWTSVDNGAMVGEYQTAPARPGGRYYDFGFTTELYGSDTSAAPTYLASLFRACGLKEETSGAGDTIFTYTASNPHLSTDTPAGDCYPKELKFNNDGFLYHAVYCVGSIRFNFVAGGIPTVDFRFLGQASTGHDEGEETASASFQVHPKPKPVQNEALTITPSGSSAISNLTIPEFSIDLNADLDPSSSVNGAYGYDAPQIFGWEPILNMLVKQELLATFDPEDYWKEGTRLDVSFTHENGGGEGHEVVFAFDMQLNEKPGREIVNGTEYWRLIGKQSTDAAADNFNFVYAGP